jgi:hypothetical protein
MFVGQTQGAKFRSNEEGLWTFVQGKIIGVHVEIFLENGEEVARFYRMEKNGEKHLMGTLSAKDYFDRTRTTTR